MQSKYRLLRRQASRNDNVVDKILVMTDWAGSSWFNLRYSNIQGLPGIECSSSCSGSPLKSEEIYCDKELPEIDCFTHKGFAMTDWGKSQCQAEINSDNIENLFPIFFIQVSVLYCFGKVLKLNIR